MKVLMTPHLKDFKTEESGIRRVVEAYFRYLPSFGVELVEPNQAFDLRAVHAGMTSADCDIAHLHGLYWTADYLTGGGEYKANANIVEALRHAKEVTVPSEWVAETVQRDMRFNPHVVPHGIDVDLWSPAEHQGYVLWNKNRRHDVCDPTPVMKLAELRPNVRFLTTYVPYKYPRVLNNVRGIGLVKHGVMKNFISHAVAYLSSTKETFCIGALEAMASGVPVLGFAWGGNLNLVEHGVNGYLAHPDDMDDLAVGLDYCIQHRDVLGANGRELAKKWDWPSAVEKVAGVYKLAMEKENEEVSIVIPHYNYSSTIERALGSAVNQTLRPRQIVVVDDGSDNSERERAAEIVKRVSSDNPDIDIRLVSQANLGVANARNRGISEVRTGFVCALDADDEIKPQFLEACVAELKKDRSLGITYTGLWEKFEDGKEQLAGWPKECNYDRQFTYRSKDNPRGQNQIPTCCVFRREAWERTGGYKQRYAPMGQGAEDAEFWTRVMSIGYGAKKVTDAGLFVYYHGGRMMKPYAEGKIDRNLLEPAWLQMHPWAKDHKHPFASRATPMHDENNRPRPSHPVRQYDEPIVSVIIPVGKGHEEMVKNALDSCEAQSFRKWEAIVVFDNGMSRDEAERLLSAYPYVRIGFTPPHKKGAGKARNIGVDLSRAPFLVFLDADDMLSPEFLDDTLSVWYETQAQHGDNSSRFIVYSDYVQKTVTTQEDLQTNFNQQDILHFNERTQEAVIAGRAAQYECERAQRQPEYKQSTDPFHWCLVTCLVPKIWHNEIGGFDEELESFEDVHYHWAMARYGMCYVHVPKQLVMYRMYTGTRRERANINTKEGLAKARELLTKIEEKLEKIPMANCSKCPSGSKSPLPAVNSQREAQSAREREEQRATDENYVLCEYINSNRGNHRVYGAVTRESYGYRGGGTVFLVHRKDIEAQPMLFRPMRQVTNAPIAENVAPGVPVPISELRGSQIEPVELSTDGTIPEYVAPKVEGATQEVEKDRKIDENPQISPPEPLPGTFKEESEDIVEAPQHLPGTISDAGIHQEVLSDVDAHEEVFAGEEVSEKFDAMAFSERPFNLDLVPGVTPTIAEQLRNLGKESREDILNLGVEGLQKIQGIGEVKAHAIIEWLTQNK